MKYDAKATYSSLAFRSQSHKGVLQDVADRGVCSLPLRNGTPAEAVAAGRDEPGAAAAEADGEVLPPRKRR